MTFAFVNDLIQVLKEEECTNTELFINIDGVLLNLECKSNAYQLIEDLELFS